MAGTKTGGIKARNTMLSKDPDFYRRIGAEGGRNGHTGGFYDSPERARLAGAKGGRKSRRVVKKVNETVEEYNARAAAIRQQVTA